MGPAGYFIAILGCADGGAACQPVATLSTRYESQASCAAATEQALIANSDLDFPTMLAQCQPAATRSSKSADPVRLPEGARRV